VVRGVAPCRRIFLRATWDGRFQGRFETLVSSYLCVFGVAVASRPVGQPARRIRPFGGMRCALHERCPKRLSTRRAADLSRSPLMRTRSPLPCVSRQKMHQRVSTGASSAKTAPHVYVLSTATEAHSEVTHAYQNGVHNSNDDRPASIAGVQLVASQVACVGADNSFSTAAEPRSKEHSSASTVGQSINSCG
jgi:hypothetical protein